MKRLGSLLFSMFILSTFLVMPNIHSGVGRKTRKPQSNLVMADNNSNRYFSFVHITDLHIGEDIKDYGSNGYDDQPETGNEGTTAGKLREAVNWVNENREEHAIEFAVITGDLTDSAEKSEFLKAKEILDELEVPYVPIIGNHDIWPYSMGELKFEERSSIPNGDSYFRDTFSDYLDGLRDSGFFQNWNDGTRNIPIWNGEADTVKGYDKGCWSYFTNYAFDYNGYHFICTDFNTRNRAPGEKEGSMPYADLYNSPLCRGTWLWYKIHLKTYMEKSPNSVITFSHQPLHINSSFTFNEEDYRVITDFLFENCLQQRSPIWISGHCHKVIEHWTPEFDFEITTENGDALCHGIHTPAVKDNPSNLRIIELPY
ncbi:MAG: metallophosphoesterase [Actinobacteria bacterium]|nr:metallophosphoesterase [Actinomycetota bacterium]